MIAWKEVIAVAFGGAIGSLLRFMMSIVVSYILPKNFPWAIWTVNILGCLFIGVLAAIFTTKEIVSVFWRAALFIGLLGGFTTFSSFSLDVLTLAQGGRFTVAMLYLFSTIAFTLLATAIGYAAVNYFIR